MRMKMVVINYNVHMWKWKTGRIKRKLERSGIKAFSEG